MSDTGHDDAVPTDTLAEGEASGDARSGSGERRGRRAPDGDEAVTRRRRPPGPRRRRDGPRGDDETVSADDLTELQDEPTAVEPTD